jgi:putative ABC transport system permease protein
VTVIAVLTIALGTGFNVANFSLADALLWKPIPLPDAERLVQLISVNPRQNVESSSVAIPEYREWRSQARSFESLVAYRYSRRTISSDGMARERVDTVEVSTDFFRTLGAKSILGRTFGPEEDRSGAGTVVILSEGLWKRRFGADSAVLGKTLELDGLSYTIVGVVGPDFSYCWRFPLSSDVWVPLTLGGWQQHDWSVRNLGVIGKVKHGAQVNRAQTEMHEIARRQEKERPEADRNWTVRVAPIREALVADVDRSVWLMTVASALVLLIACANVASLQLARGTSRLSELAVRLAVGAGRWRIVRHLLTESVLLAAMGAAAGALFAIWGVRWIRSSMPAEISGFIAGWNEIRLDGRAMIFDLCLALISGVVFGLAPALASSKPDLVLTLKETSGGPATGRRPYRIRNGLVALQMSLALALLIGALLTERVFAKAVGEGRQVQGVTVLTAHYSLDRSRYPRTEQVAAIQEELLKHLQMIPGAESAAIASGLPFASYPEPSRAVAQGGTREWTCYVDTVSPGFFKTLRIPLRQGRYFLATDKPGTPPVAIVSERLARDLFAGRDALGHRVEILSGGSARSWATIVGVSADYRHNLFDRVQLPTIFLPSVQTTEQLRDMKIMVRGQGNAANLASALREAVRRMDAEAPLEKVRTLKSVIDEQMTILRGTNRTMVTLGILALALSLGGVYALMARSVVERAGEIGVRMALGATPRDVIRLIMAQCGGVALAGVLAGLPVAWALTRLLVAFLFDLTFDAGVAAAGVLLITTAAFSACYLPARRAASLDPWATLRAG